MIFSCIFGTILIDGNIRSLYRKLSERTAAAAITHGTARGSRMLMNDFFTRTSGDPQPGEQPSGEQHSGGQPSAEQRPGAEPPAANTVPGYNSTGVPPAGQPGVPYRSVPYSPPPTGAQPPQYPPQYAPYTVPGRHERTPQSVYGSNPYYGGINPIYVYNGKYVNAQREKRALHSFSAHISAAMIGYILITMLILFAVGIIDLHGLYGKEYFFTSGVDILISVLSIGVPFFVLFRLLRGNGNSQMCDFSSAPGKSRFVLAVIMGFALCLGANYLIMFLASFAEQWGVVFPEYEDVPVPINAAGVAVLLVKTAVIPAMVEELALRGIVLQSLRKYGTVFAITASSCVFALLHGSAVQIPFAFLAGLALGYVYCLTESIWACVLVHMLNNAFSCAELVLYETYSEQQAFNIMTVLTVIIAVLGVAALVILWRQRKLQIRSEDSQLLTLKQRCGAFFLRPGFVLAAGVFIVFAASDVSVK